MALSIPPRHNIASCVSNNQQEDLNVAITRSKRRSCLTNDYVMSEVFKAACNSARTRQPKVIMDVIRAGVSPAATEPESTGCVVTVAGRADRPQ